MYYDSNVVEIVLTCTFCRSKFSGLVHLIPECGNSICAECHEDLKAELDSEAKYKCRVCSAFHTMPQPGLALNNALMHMLQVKPEQKALPENALKLKQDIEYARSKAERLELIDEAEEINTHCDILALQISEAVESGVKHLNRVGQDMLKDVEEYRARLLGNSSSANFRRYSNDPDYFKAVGRLKKQITTCGKRWNERFSSITQLVRDTEIEAARYQVKNLSEDLNDLEVKMKDLMFQERVLRFRVDSKFCLRNDNLGFLEYEMTTDVQRKTGKLFHSVS